METTNIEISKNTKCFIKQHNVSKQNIESLGRQFNQKPKVRDYDNEGAKQLTLKITIGLIEVTLHSEIFQ